MPSWKKIIVSGSNAELNQITSSAGINIKTVGSLTNGISFGDGNTGFYETADNDLKFDRAGSNVFQANTSSQLAFGVSSLFRNTTGGFLISTGATTTGANYSFRGDENTGIGRPAADQVSVIAGGVQELIVKANTISGSAQSTGSFGFVTGNKLGIGTTSPDHFAHLVMDGNDRLLIQNLSVGSDNTIELKANAKSSFIFNNPSTGHLFIRTDVATEDVILQSNNSGNVGIGNLTEASEKLHVVGNGLFTGDLNVDGNITAQNYIVSSSVTSINYQSLSGSTIFGDSNDDTHEFTGSVSFSGSIVQPHMDGNATALSLLGGAFTVSNPNLIFTANGGEVRFGASNASFNHSAGRVYTRKDGGYAGGSNVAFLATDHPVGAGFWVDSAGNMKFGHDDGAGARTVVDMMTLGPQSGHASGSLLVSGSIIAKEGNISGSATSTGSFGHLVLGK